MTNWFLKSLQVKMTVFIVNFFKFVLSLLCERFEVRLLLEILSVFAWSIDLHHRFEFIFAKQRVCF